MTWLSRYKLRKILLANLKLIVNSKLSEEEKQELKGQLATMKALIEFQDYKAAKGKIQEFEMRILEKLRPPFWQRSLGWILGMVVALSLALLIRQEWFELYEIPSGSMRPTLKESDRLSVSKTSFGVNFPFSTGHLWFDPTLVKHSEIITFTGENMDIADVDTTYFGFLPGKRQFVKRICGKPLDTIYFQAGQLTGLSASGQNLFTDLNPSYLGMIDRVPVIGFEWNVVVEKARNDQGYDASIYYLMNEPVARLKKDASLGVKADWVKNSLFKNLDEKSDFYDLLGIKTYAQTRVVWNFEKDSVKEYPLVLQLKHHPSFKGAKLDQDFYGRYRPMLHYSNSQILLSQPMIDRLFSGLSTGRFNVINGVPYRYPYSPTKPSRMDLSTHLENVPDGVYELINGKAYQIQFGGVATELKQDHPLLQKTPAIFVLFYNQGYEFDERMNPTKNKSAYPNRFAYFRDGDLFVQGHLFLQKNDPALEQFNHKEQELAAKDPLHIPFSLEQLESPEAFAKQVKKFGLLLPEKRYLALGDNPPVSSDSRDFGLLPEENLRGSPVLIFWPPGERWGMPAQPKSPTVNPARALIWSLAALGIGSWIFFERRKRKQIPKWEDL